MELKKLKAPFLDKDINWRVQQANITRNGQPWAIIIPYVDSRAVQDRLDKVVGEDSWRAEFRHVNGGVMCDLSIFTTKNGWVTKSDGSDNTEIEAFKGGISKSLVRAAVMWGIGRYLYDLPITFAKFVDKKTAISQMQKIKTPDGDKYFHWEPPMLNKNVADLKVVEKKNINEVF